MWEIMKVLLQCTKGGVASGTDMIGVRTHVKGYVHACLAFLYSFS
jgi:hypothetical protein